jgi:CRISPR-associated protein Cmr5
MSSPQQTVEQRRAADAWVRISSDVKGKKFEGEYKSLARSLPADILTNGLGQTLAFLCSKGKKDSRFKDDSEHATLYQHVSAWVVREMEWGSDDLLDRLIDENTGSDDYRRATVETLAYLVWLKRFAEAELKGGE